MNVGEVVAELSKLVELEIDAVHAYDAAVVAVGGGGTTLGADLGLLKVEHQQHALELYDAFLRLGVNPPDVEPDVKGPVIGAITPPRRNLSPEEVLEAVRGNEKLTCSVYAKAARKALPPDLQVTVARLHEDEQRHLEWVDRALARRAWEPAVAAAHP
jgi:hypothetical protein